MKMMSKNQRSRLFILVLALTLLPPAFFLYAQTGGERTSKSKCLKEFDVEKINFRDPFFLEKTKTRVSDLQYYFKCTAAMKSAISECDRLNPTDAAACRQNYNFHHGFYRQLLSARSSKQPPTQEMIIACTQEMDYDERNCRIFLDAFVREDASICNRAPFSRSTSDCRAFITLNPALAIDKHTRGTVNYLNAMNDSSADKCRQILGTHGKRECEAYVTQNKKVCEGYNEFSQFRETYCSEVAQGKI